MVRTLSFFIFLSFLAACGSGTLTEPSGTITSEQASSFTSSYASQLEGTASIDASGAKTFVQTGAQSNSRRHLLSLAGISTTASAPREDAACSGTVSGDSTDADSDEINLNQTTTFDCSYTTSFGTGNLSGSFAIVDKDDAAVFPLGGGTITVSDLTNQVNFGEAVIGISVNGSFDATAATSTISTTNNFKTTVSAANQEASVTYQMGSTATPTDMDSPLAGGTVTFSGFIQIEGGDQDFTLQVTATDVTYGGCSRDDFKLNTGTVTLVDGSSNTITFTYENCTRTAAYNGNSL